VSDVPDLSHHSRSLAWLLAGAVVGDDDLFVCFNAWNQPLRFALPARDSGHGPWQRVVDTALASPSDIVAEGDERAFADAFTYDVAGHSLAVFLRARR
jgi:isoamylase